ncbi:PIN domain-containing protein [Ruminococcus albus]|uniref:PIN-like domain-containing protein n=1 Tax=Ruminococcus albus TaxID=1264 RepID=A0A1I1GNV1_RUMAL|nr:PIN domain-containing protein [Ruminococcus albus]SFC10953.1 hypothetical protein SAMN02910406_01176 [Ruminococcus albus]
MSSGRFNRYFLIDYENVGVSGLNGIDELTDSDSVTIFFSEHAQSLTFEYHNKINAAKADIDLIMVEAGEKNALDFQLSSYLGYIISENINYFPDEPVTYYIIARDTGYKPLVSFWNKKAEIKQFTDLSMMISTNDYLAEISEKNSAQKKAVIENGITLPAGCQIPPNAVNYILENVERNINLTQDILNLSAMGGLKTDLHSLLVRSYNRDTKKAGNIYQTIKHLFE